MTPALRTGLSSSGRSIRFLCHLRCLNGREASDGYMGPNWAIKGKLDGLDVLNLQKFLSLIVSISPFFEPERRIGLHDTDGGNGGQRGNLLHPARAAVNRNLGSDL